MLQSLQSKKVEVENFTKNIRDENRETEQNPKIQNHFNVSLINGQITLSYLYQYPITTHSLSHISKSSPKGSVIIKADQGPSSP
jgi:hypothetical protein